MRRRSSTKGAVYTYTVYSNCEGGIVYIDNVSSGTIRSGKFVFERQGGNEGYNIRISGGVPSNGESTSTETTQVYNMSTGPRNFTFDSSGGTQQLNGIQSSVSTGTRTKYNPYSYTAPNSAVVRRNSSVTMNYSGPYYGTPTYSNWSYGPSRRHPAYWDFSNPSWLSISSSNSGDYNTNLTLNCSSNSGGARFTRNYWVQADSNKKMELTVSQDEYTPPVYTYTVYSNCIGGSVYFDMALKGTINSSGVFKISITNGDTYYRVTISGGVPSKTYGNWEYTFTPPTLSSFPASGGKSSNVAITSKKSRTVKSYTAPSFGDVRRNGNVTMNYSINNGSEQQYVSWNHSTLGSWLSYKTVTYGTHASPLEVGYYTCTANSGLDRGVDFTYKQNESAKTYRTTISQYGKK